MPDRPASTGDLIDLAVQLHRDETLPEAELRRRDRAIGKELPPTTTHAEVTEARALAWLNHIDDRSQRGHTAMTLAGWAAIGLGALLGYAAAMAVFYYDGSQPINVLNVLGVFVFAQTIFLLLFILAALPGRGGLQQSLREISPGWLAGLVTRWMPGETRDALRSIVGRAGGHQRVFGKVQKWQVLNWSQLMAVAFNLAALAGAMQLIVTSDLAFSWSTTLDVEPTAMHGLVEAVSLPWSMWEAAVVPLSVVEQTRTFRSEGFGQGEVEAGVFLRWWRFLFMAMLIYGLLPRVITFLIARRNLKASVAGAVRTLPGLDRVMHRLTAPAITSTGIGENDETPKPTDVASGNGHDSHPAADPACVIAWSGAEATPDALPAGGGSSLEQDRQTIQSAASHPDGPVQVRVKAWEPPTLDLIDFIGELRKALGDGRVIEVMPLGAEADRQDLDAWRSKLTLTGDPWVRLVQSPGHGGRT
jgi:hypothetical protein